jgi:bromodomain adjacent to zinc finger domain protein 1A
MADVGNNWERVPLRFSENRSGWEDAMVGALKDVRIILCLTAFSYTEYPVVQHATIENFPRLREVLTRLLFAPEDVEMDRESSDSRASSPIMNKGPEALSVPASPLERYYTLPAEDRISILAFMCNIAVSSKAIHAHMESCEEQLTALRKEKIEVNRAKKQ